MNLTDSEKLAISKGEAIRTVEDGIPVVVIREDVYENFRASLPSEVVTALCDETMARYDAHDPLLESYQKLEP